MTYKPKPKDTSKVWLTAELKRLTERLAENTHDVWAERRLAEGWRYGRHRNDARKRHPCLVPYSRLPESEKEYDRKTAVETVKMLLALGYSIESPEDRRISARGSSSRNAAELARLGKTLETTGGADLATLVALWNGRDPEVWSESVEIFRLLAGLILKMGEPLLAYDVIDEGRKYFPADVRLRQLLALSLKRSGASDAAHTVLVELQREGRLDEETLGLLAGTYKDLADAPSDPEARKNHLIRAHKLYTRSYRLTGGYWSGINAATLALVLGNRSRARAVVGRVREQCRSELKRLAKQNGDLYWPLATLGEAALILGNWSEAADWYSQAVEVAGKNYGNVHATRRNARLLMEHLEGDDDLIERCFRIPAVVVFAGHMVDQPGRPFLRFPPQLERAVRDAIRERLHKLNAGFGYSSAACGSDVLFLEAMLELGGEAQLILPYEQSQFIADSVDIIPGARWGTRCKRLLERATGITVASNQRLTGGSVQYEYANRMLHGMAALRSEQLGTNLAPLAVWDGKPGDGPGGTASTVGRWRKSGLHVEVIRLDEILRSEGPVLSPASRRQAALSRPAASPQSEFAPDICGLLFADAVGFSKLTENEVPLFVRHFLGLVGKLTEKSPYAPVVKNTWGDGLYFVFPGVSHAGQFALELCDRIAKTDWKAKGLRELNLRVGVHGGPVYGCVDPVTRHRNYIGAHVSRAARIEPVTPPGHVYGSEAFAALAAAEGVREFACDYVGRVSMAKNYGTFPTYLIRRR